MEEELEISCQQGNLENVIHLIDDCNISVNTRFFFNYTPLHIACMHDHPPIVAALFERGADANAKDEHNRTPLLISRKNAEIVSLLLKNNADLNALDRDGMTPLHWACNYNSFSVVKLLVENNCEINIYSNLKVSPLMLATMHGNFEIIKFLFDSGAEVYQTNVLGNNILHYAAFLDHLDIGLFLTRKYGFDPTLLNQLGESALNSYGKSLELNIVPPPNGNNSDWRPRLTTEEKAEKTSLLSNSYADFLLEKKRNENWIRRKDFTEMLFGCKILLMQNLLNIAQRKQQHDNSNLSIKIPNDKFKNYRDLITKKVLSNIDLIKVIMSFV
jgi:ankyrin repeat protein